MKRAMTYLRKHKRQASYAGIVCVAIASLMLWRLGTLLPGLSSSEQMTRAASLGWHGIYQHPFYLPLEIVRSVIFTIFPDPGHLILRLAGTLFGGLAILAFWEVLRVWHGNRTAAFATVLFATSAWTLHSSRLASFDVMYLWAAPTLLLMHVLIQKRPKSISTFYGSSLIWGLCLYIPGLVWIVLLDVYRVRSFLSVGWRHFGSWKQRSLYVLSWLVWLPLLAHHLINKSSDIKIWLGLPAHFASVTTVLKDLIAVPIHLFVRGPQYPEQWLGRAPIFDIFSLVVCLLGIYFYARHWQASRSKLLGSFLVISGVLVGLGGAVSLSFLVPILYMIAATGIAYLLHDWLKTFPLNPIARAIGFGLVTIAIAVSCIYNLRAYFVAWPHNDTTQATFRYTR